MFENIKVDAKLIGAGIVVAIILVVVGVLLWQHHEVKDLTQQTGADKNVIAQQDAAASNAAVTIKNQQATAVNTDQTTAAIAASDVAVQAKQEQVENTTQQQIAVVNQQYQSQPATPATSAARMTAISQIQIDSLWDTYCQSVDSDPQCPASAPVAASQ
jgi:FtsZ-interacting cell division protein ZipA